MTANAIVLDNGLIRVSFDPTTGGITSLVDLRDATEHLPAATQRTFRLIAGVGELLACPFDGERQTVTGSDMPDGRHVTFHYSGLVAQPGVDPQVELPITLAAEWWLEDDCEVRTRLSVQNASPHAIHEIQFPLVSGWTTYGGPDHDLITTGAAHSSGRMNPHADNISREVDWYTLLGAQLRWQIRYPNHTATPWLDLSGSGRGMGIVNYMRKGMVGGALMRDFSGYAKAKVMELGWYTLSEVRTGARWTSPTFGIALHHGDWHATADRYHDWLTTWWQPAIAPEAFRRQLGFQNVIVQDFDGVRFRHFRDLPGMVEAAKTYGITDLCIWDYLLLGNYQRRDERGLHDYSDAGRAELIDAIAQCRALGAAVSTLTNVRLVLPTSTFWQDGGAEAAIRNMDGMAVQESWAAATSEAAFFAPWRGPQSTALCPRSAAFRELADTHLDVLTEYGFNAMFLDQPNETSPCYDESHGHADSADTHDAVVDWVTDYRKRFDPHGRGGYVLGEQPDPFTVTGIDVFWNWGWKRARPDVVAYTFPEITFTYVVDRDRRDALEGFLHGFQLALCPRGLTGDMRDDPEFSEFIRQLSILRSATADATTLARFVDDRGITMEGGLRAKRFVSDSDSTSSVVLTNPTDHAASGTLRLTDGAARWRDVRISATADGRRTVRKVGDDLVLDVQLPAWAALVWELSALDESEPEAQVDDGD